ncbi:hypothetical protein GW17_00027686 [Ensete ventricosum]|nr:hypothetical protein GW17_00027686 [Ensete ventricosum]
MAVPTAAAGDADEWVNDACLHPHLVAAVLLSFRRRSRLDSETECDEKPSTSATPAPTALLEWGKKRSRMMRLPRTISWPMGEEEEEVAAAAERKGKRRASPQSPLEGYSSASASGGDEGARVSGSACLIASTPDDRLTKGDSRVLTRPLEGAFPSFRTMRGMPTEEFKDWVDKKTFPFSARGRQPTGTVGFIDPGFELHPTATVEENDEAGATGGRENAAGRESEAS